MSQNLKQNKKMITDEEIEREITMSKTLLKDSLPKKCSLCNRDIDDQTRSVQNKRHCKRCNGDIQ